MQSRRYHSPSLVILAIAIFASGQRNCSADDAPKPIDIADVKRDGTVDFHKDILPIMKAKCLACHNAKDAEADLVLETPETILAGAAGEPIVAPGDASKSRLLIVAAHQDDPVMPPADNDVGAANLTPGELGLLKLWIEQGAKASKPAAPTTVQWQPLPGASGPVYAIALSPRGRYVAAGRGTQIILYHADTKELICRLSDPSISPDGPAHLDLVQSLAFSPDGNRIASGGFRTVKLWRRQLPRHVSELKTSGSPVSAFAVSGDGKLCAVGEQNGAVQVVETASGKVVHTLKGHSGPIASVDISVDGELVIASAGNALRAWTADGKEAAAIEATSPIAAVAIVADNTQLATSHEDGVIRVWPLSADSTDRKPLADFAGHNGKVTALATFGDANNQLLSGGADGTVRHWDLPGKRQVRQMQHGGQVTSVAVRSDAKRFCSAGESRTAKLWNADNGQMVAELRGDTRAKAEVEGARRRVEVAKRRIEAADADHKAAIETKKQEDANVVKVAEEIKKAREELKQKTEAAAKAPKDKNDKQAAEQKAAERRLQSIEQSEPRAKTRVQQAAEAVARFEQTLKSEQEQLKNHESAVAAADKVLAESTHPIRAVAFSPSGARLAFAGDDGRVHIFGAEKGTPLLAFGEGGKITELAYAADDRLLASGDTAAVSIWDAGEQWNLERTIGAVDDPATLVDRVTSLSFSPDGKLLATGGGEPSRSGQIKIWQTEDGGLVREFVEPHSDTIYGLAYSPDGKHIAGASADRTTKVFDAATGETMKTYEGHTHHVLGVAWRADGRALATSGADGAVKTWRFPEGGQIKTIDGFAKEATSIQYIGLDDNFVVAAGNGAVTTRTTTGGGGPNFGGARDFVYCVRTSIDGQRVAAGDAAGVVHVWDARGGKIAAFGPPDETPNTESK